MQVCRDASRDGLKMGSVAMRKRSVDATGHQADMRVQLMILIDVLEFNGSRAGHGAELQYGGNLGIACLDTDGDIYMTGYGADLKTVV